jgi:hypothetical protein
LIDLESSTYFGHNFPHRLQLEFNSSCQIILGIDRRHINLSRKFFLVDGSACLIDSDFRTYFGQNLSHILELGFDPSRQIILEQPIISMQVLRIYQVGAVRALVSTNEIFGNLLMLISEWVSDTLL